MISKKLLHATEELRWLSIAEVFSTNELLELALLQGGRAFDELRLQLVVWVFSWRTKEVVNFSGEVRR